jgi:2-dehydro-3-deoxyphosphogluconate aldolase / (4S)-4-hydroxy-2-oxoglutarate aldolase
MGEAIASGAQFLFTPHVSPALIEMAIAAQIPIIPGALTPTEIVTAWQAGATCVKVFPIQAMGGAEYLRSLRAPLGDLPLIPTGGVTVENARTFLEAGAIAVGLSGQLFPQAAIEQADWQAITAQVQRLVKAVSSDGIERQT